MDALNDAWFKTKTWVLGYSGPDAYLLKIIESGKPFVTHVELLQISNLLFRDPDNFSKMMYTIWEQIYKTNGYNISSSLKALHILEFLVNNGSKFILDDVSRHITVIRTLSNFTVPVSTGSLESITTIRAASSRLLALLADKMGRIMKVYSPRKQSSLNEQAPPVAEQVMSIGHMQNARSSCITASSTSQSGMASGAPQYGTANGSSQSGMTSDASQHIKSISSSSYAMQQTQGSMYQPRYSADIDVHSLNSRTRMSSNALNDIPTEYGSFNRQRGHIDQYPHIQDNYNSQNTEANTYTTRTQGNSSSMPHFENIPSSDSRINTYPIGYGLQSVNYSQESISHRSESTTPQPYNTKPPLGAQDIGAKKDTENTSIGELDSVLGYLMKR